MWKGGRRTNWNKDGILEKTLNDEEKKYIEATDLTLLVRKVRNLKTPKEFFNVQLHTLRTFSHLF